jgi:hypothetical protein
LQFAEAGIAAKLPQQEKSSSQIVQRGCFIPRGCTFEMLDTFSDSFTTGAPWPTYV